MTTIATRCFELIAERGPLTADELGEILRAEGRTTAKVPAQSAANALSYDARVVRRPDRRYVAARDLVAGRVFTHVISEAERATGRLEPGADHPFLVALALGGLPIVGGGVLLKHGSDGARGPGDWLDRFDEGTTIALRHVDGAVAVEPAAFDDDAARRAEQVRALLSPRFPFGWSYTAERDLCDALVAALSDDPSLLRAPVPPLGELVLGPRPAREPAFGTFDRLPEGTLRLPLAMFEDIRCAASCEAMDVEEWVVEQLEQGVQRVVGRGSAPVVPIRFR